ncbi:zinc finger BED domain-containing protein RICESLEEPER 2-like [Pistacia vera]|uniref:zinc finger BED domain-containing protein RICESLEEPER 2-like n=1 Tax=Pistacia vera TaxID=55513 RepID=UPI0012637B74|nr:zinc finger BED domain-containing protein RICESLEEPER 2-like [Pistacia vera]
MDCFYEWNIDRKLSTLMFDNCSTNNAVVEDILNELPSASLMLRGSLFHMRCCAHVLNLIVQDGLLVIRQAIARIRESVAYWSASPKREQKFVKASRQEGIELCETQYRCLPTEEEWELAEQVCSKLKIFYVAINLFSGTKYLTSNIYFPKVCEIRIALSSWLRCRNDLIRNMATKMLEKFSKNWDVIHDVLGVASVLDPKYKMKSLDYFFPLIYEVDGKDHIMRIQGFLSDFFNQYQSRQRSSQPPPNARSFQTNIPYSEEDGSVSDFEMYIAQESNVMEGKSELDFLLRGETFAWDS